MNWRVEWSERTIDDLRHLPPRDARWVMNAMERYASTGHGDVRKIRGHRGLFRLRSGVWRILFTPDTEARCLYVPAVSHRREAYRGD